MDRVRYWLGFNRTPGIGPARLRALIQRFGNVEDAWKASPSDLRAAGLDQRTLASLLATRQSCDLDAELRAVERAGAHIILFEDPAYPAALRSLPDPPPLLYVKGSLLEADSRALAVVGTRTATEYGKTMTARIVEPLARAGLVIVSGLAHGIDAVAHRSALRAGGRTLAVFACGIDRLYPPDSTDLAAAITASGALISELPLGTPPGRLNFPARNRIISGLALGVLVVEAGAKSGALITADQALDQGRDVFAVPGNVLSPVSAGTNALIRAGAIPVEKAADILEALRVPYAAPASAPTSTGVALPTGVPPRQADAASPTMPLPAVTDPVEVALLRALGAGPSHVNDLAHACDLPIGQISSTLTILELKGLVRQAGVLTYSLADAFGPEQ
jgi:DNA processing protein